MAARIINGKALADVWLDDIAEQVRALGAPLHLAAVCGGDDPGLRSFVRLKQKAAQSVGMTFSSYFFDADDPAGARSTLEYLAADVSVDGIFIELPLPAAWDAGVLLGLIPSEKDVDALTAHPLVPAPAVRALQRVLEHENIVMRGLDVAVVGHGKLVGQPIAQWLREQGALVRVIDEHTEDPERSASDARLIITGVGKAGLISADWIRDGATIIDFGYAQGRGDVDADSVMKKAGALTPVPGGMGPLVVAAVLENLVELATR